MGITQAEKGRFQKKVASYVWKLRSEMWLNRWTIDVLVTEYPGEDSDARAAITPVNGRYKAELEVATYAAEAGGEDLRHVIVHELLHLWHRDSNDIFRLALPKELSQSAYTLLWEAYRQSLELMVDDMSYAWAEKLPLPEWGNES